MRTAAEIASSGVEALADAALPAADVKQRGGRLWLAFVLALVALLAAIDRQAFSVLLVPIQKDLKVGDAAMGAITGTAFALVYAILAIPLARVADRSNRRILLSAAVAVWSLATVLCGAAGSYLTLLLARVGVAGAESAQMPTTMSLIGDSFPAARRGAAIGIVIVGGSLGYSLGAALAGLLSDRFNWHVALMVVGAPGLVLAAITFLTIREPGRGAQERIAGGVAAPPPLGACLRRFASIRSLRYFAVGFVLLNASFQGWLIWAPVFLMRVHHLSATRMGAVFGGIIAGAALSNVISGSVSDRFARRAPHLRLYFCCGVILLCVPFLAASTLVADLRAAIVCLIAYTLISGGLTTVCAASYIGLSPPNMRGLMTAVMSFCSAVFGSFGGPLLYGAVNDLLKPTWGDQSLRYTLLISPVLMVLAGVLFIAASRRYDDDVAEQLLA